MSEQPIDQLDVTLLIRITQAFNSSLELDVVLNRVMDEVIEATGAERGFVMLQSPIGGFEIRTARGLDHTTIEAPELEVSRSIVERVVETGEAVMWSTLDGSTKSLKAIGALCLLCVPLMYHGELKGVIYVDSRLTVQVFGPPHKALMSAIADIAVIALENARLFEEMVEKERMKRELEVAQEVQRNLLPNGTPHFPGWEFATFWQPAREVSGDFFDFILLDGEHLGLVIADVSDKGMPAALFMAMSRSVVRNTVSLQGEPAESITRANHLICEDAANGMFVSLAYAEIDTEGHVIMVNAGHNAPLLLRAEAADIETLHRTGMVLGLFDTETFEQRIISMQSGDILIMYTDGVTEATNSSDHEFGLDRLLEVVHKYRTQPLRDIVRVLRAELEAFTDARPPFDDITLLMARRL